ncbi:hypothetical protein NDU88_001643 [Pleurodeles waltl]|uniref:Uncharacterized protein n=1 Tax=Pleurodeles waltl TaxID=8319 RepID=A0AAV7V8D0_PLEWA|nr:hypothetical protein NDU88_001643 [Pleurodeles waltl]
MITQGPEGDPEAGRAHGAAYHRRQARGTAARSRRQAGTGGARGGAKESPEDTPGLRLMAGSASPRGAGAATGTMAPTRPQ